MKKLTTLFLMVFLLQTSNTKAQITLDTTISIYVDLGWGFKIAQISATETKYYKADTVTNTFSLYNMDFTPFLTNIAVPQPFNPSNNYYQAMYITRTLFDCDSTNIEYLYERPAGGGCGNKLYVMRTDGTQLLYLDSARCPYCFGDCYGGESWTKPIVNTSSGAKLFVNQPYCGAIEFYKIYSLCGTIPISESVFDFTNMSQSFIQVFPNPSSSSLTFQINLPDNLNEYELVIVDNNAKEIKRERINSSFDKYVIDVSSLSSGHYFYSLCTKAKTYQSGKFMITK